MERRDCQLENKIFVPGSKVCDEKCCYLCAEGEWEQIGALDFIMGGP